MSSQSERSLSEKMPSLSNPLLNESSEEIYKTIEIPKGGDESRYPKSRWFVLLAFSLLSYTNSWIWITWSPIEEEAADMWNVKSAAVDNLSGLYMFIYLPASFPAMWLVERLGMRTGLLFGAVLNVVGAALRWTGTYHYNTIYIGTIFCGIAQAFILSIPALLSHTWFAANERGLATSIGVLANQLGAAVGLGATILLDTSAHGVLENYLSYQFYFSSASCVLCIIFVRDTPIAQSDDDFRQSRLSSRQQHSSPLHNHDESVPYLKTLWDILRNGVGFIHLFIYGMVIAVYYAIAVFLSQMLPSWRLLGTESNEEIGWLGVTLVMVGLVGSLVTGKILDSTGAYRQICLGVLTGCVASFALFIWFVVWDEGANHAAVFIATAAAGFFTTAYMSHGMEYATTIAYPANEGIVCGILNCVAQVFGMLYIYVKEQVMGENEYADDIATVSYFLGGMLVLGLLMFVGVFYVTREQFLRSHTHAVL